MPFTTQGPRPEKPINTKTRSSVVSPLAYALGGAAGALALGLVGWAIVSQPWAQKPNPFTPAVVASLKFPVYYPTKLPADYHIDRNSVNEPQGNVVVLTMLGPGGAKLYMSEEVRPDRYNVGGYFQSLDNLKELPVQGGTIAIGQGTNSETVASRLYNNTWILANTHAAIPKDQLIKMLQSMTLAY
jgi:hypothetical protein